MVRDNDINSQDSYIVEKLTINDLCRDTIEKYRTGSGIPLIFTATKEQGYSTPTFQDFFNPDYTIVTIYLSNACKSQNMLDIGDNKLDIKYIIKNLSIRNDIKERLSIIYEQFNNDIFSSSSIVELINCSRSSSDNYIKVLRANNLIEPVRGSGKGKYKFKQ